MLASRVRSALPLLEVSEFNNTLRLYFCNKDIKIYNYRYIRNLGNPILVIKAEHTGTGARSTKEDNTKGLGAKLYLALSYRVILTSNI